MTNALSLEDYFKKISTTHSPEFKTVTIKELSKELDYSLIITEGVRSSGKTYVATRLSEILNLPLYQVWRSLGGLKQFIKDDVGKVSLDEFSLDINQSNIFTAEFVAQNNLRVIFDRSYFTAMQFNNEVHLDRLNVYYRILEKAKSCVLFIKADDYTFSRRIKERGIPYNIISEENKRYLGIINRIPLSIPVLYREVCLEAK